MASPSSAACSFASAMVRRPVVDPRCSRTLRATNASRSQPSPFLLFLLFLRLLPRLLEHFIRQRPSDDIGFRSAAGCFNLPLECPALMWQSFVVSAVDGEPRGRILAQ